MFGLGLPELILLLIIGLVFFGPGKLPSVGKAMGQSMREFKEALHTADPAVAPTTVTATTPAEAVKTEAKADQANDIKK